MAKEIYRYAFVPDTDIDEVEASLVLAIFATESLHGESQTRLDAAHYFDGVMRKCVIDSSTAVGRDLNRLCASQRIWRSDTRLDQRSGRSGDLPDRGDAMSVAGKAMVRPSGKRGVMSSGKAGVHASDEDCCH